MAMPPRARLRKTRMEREWMSLADYGQEAEDHQRLLVLVRKVGTQLPSETFERVYDRVYQLRQVDIAGQQRTVHIKFRQNYPLENNEWGDFQAHRKLLGLVCVGQCQKDTDLADLYGAYDDLKSQYVSTLFDTRLIVLGLTKEGKTIPSEKETGSSSGESPSDEVKDNVNTQGNCQDERNNMKDIDKSNKIDEKHIVNSDNNHNDNKLQSKDPPDKFQDPLHVNVKPTSGKTSPVPQKLAITSNSSPRTTPKQSPVKEACGGGLNRTHPLAANPRDGSRPHVIFYPSLEESSDLEERLREFAASLFWVLESKRLDRSQERLEKLPLLMTPFEKKDFVGIDTENRLYRKRCQGRLRKQLGDLCLLAGQPVEALLHYQTSLDILRSANDWLWLGAAYEGLCAASVILMYSQQQPARAGFNRNQSFSLKRGVAVSPQVKLDRGRSAPNGLDLADSRGRSVLLPDDVIDKYREALVQYAKFKNAGIIELEASIKACKVLIRQQKYLEASEFLQNVVYINIQLTDEEKIERYTTLSLLYGQLGMRRKSAFFRRVAALQCVSPQNPRQDWSQFYYLMLQSLEGFSLSVDPQDIPQGQRYGWPIVQIRVLQELIYAVRRIREPDVVIRHLCLLLHVMFEELNTEERTEIANHIESFTVKSPGLQKTLSLDHGIILPPVPLTKLPVIKRFRLQDAPPHMRPSELKLAKAAQLNASPFIYSPIISGHGHQDQADATKMSFQWVEGDVCEVPLQLYNPMPFELKVSQLGLMTTGVKFDSYPISITLPAESGPFPAKIIGTPKDTGTLKVKGYTSTVLGVHSECLLSDVVGVEHDHYSIEVVPCLPQLQVATTLPKSSSFTSVADSAHVVTSAQANVYSGESLTCNVTLSNTGKETIEFLKLMLDSKVQPDLLGKVLHWDQQELDSQLPLEPNATATFSLHVYGASDFLPLRQTDTLFSPRSKASRWFSGEVGSSDTEDASDAVILDVLLKLQYSGGPGYVEQYCRQCSVALTVEILPSLVFNKWNVLAQENGLQCHLVFDVENVTSHDISVTYSSEGEMLIDARECKRLCIEIDRCEFPRFDEVPLEPRSKYMEGCQVTRQDLYAQHVAQFVDVRWKMHGTENHGKVSIERLRWNMEQVGVLTKPPFVWEWWIDSSTNDSGPLCRCLGEEIIMKCAITNQSNCDIVDAVLTTTCYQELGNGTRFPAGEHAVLSLGRDSTTCSRTPTQGTLHHEMTLTFLCAGRYRVEGHCSGRRQLADDGTVEAGAPSSNVQVLSSIAEETEQWTCSQLVFDISP